MSGRDAAHPDQTRIEAVMADDAALTSAPDNDPTRALAEPASWSWKPLTAYEIDLMIGGRHLVAVIEADQRREVADSLARLADAVDPGPTTITVGWADAAVTRALTRLVQCRDSVSNCSLNPQEEAVQVAIDCIRAVIGETDA